MPRSVLAGLHVAPGCSASATSALADFFVGCFGFMKGFVVSGAVLKRENFSTANRVDERIKAPELRRLSFARALRRFCRTREQFISGKEDALGALISGKEDAANNKDRRPSR